jgi:lysophospholipase L1-like esterase
MKPRIYLALLGALLAGGPLLSAAEPLALKNGELELSADGKLAGWRVAPDSTVLASEPVEGRAEAGHAVSVKVEDAADSSNGQITQRIAVPSGTGKVRVSGLVRGSIARAGYLEIKLFAAKKELQRVRSEASRPEWADLSVEVDTTGADQMEVLCRWSREKKYLGAKVDFANIRFTPIGKTVALVGDSRMADNGRSSLRKGWGEALKGKLLPSVSVQNFAAAGQTAKSFREEGHWAKVLEAKPDIVLIQFGASDYDPDRPGAELVSDFAAQLTQYVAEAKAAGIQPVLVTPAQERRFKDGRPDLALGIYAMQTLGRARELGVPGLDLYGPSTKRLAELGEDGSVSLFCSYKDRGHYSAQGADWIAGLAAEALAKTGPEGKALLAVAP